MRRWSIAALMLVSTGCQVTARAPASLRIAANATVRADLRAQANVSARASAEPVPFEGAEVVEFFGVPLEGTPDVVFVLDRSGSMDDRAQGAIAQISIDKVAQPAAVDPAVVAPPGPPVEGAVEDAPESATVEGAPESATAEGAPPPADGGAVEGAPPPADGGAVAVTAPSGPDPAPGPSATMVGTPAAPQLPRKIDIAQAELVEALLKLPAGTRVNVIFFNDTLEAFAPTMVPLEDGDRELIVRFVRETTPWGPTALSAALRTAFLMNASRVVLLSDGLGNVGGDPDVILRDAREAMRGGVRIDTIGLGYDQDAPLLRALAEESGGLYQDL